MEKINSIDEIFGNQEFVENLKNNIPNNQSTYLSNQLSNEKAPSLYLTITNTKTNQSEVYIINFQTNYNDKNSITKDHKLNTQYNNHKIDTNYRKCAWTINDKKLLIRMK